MTCPNHSTVNRNQLFIQIGPLSESDYDSRIPGSKVKQQFYIYSLKAKEIRHVFFFHRSFWHNLCLIRQDIIFKGIAQGQD